METYSIVIFFSSDRAFVNVTDFKAARFIFESSKQYSTRVLVNQNGAQCLLEDNEEADSIRNEHTDCEYIENIIMHVYNNYILKQDHDDQLFSHYLKYIVNDFIEDHQRLLCLNQSNSGLVFVTPRIWGYHISKTDMQAIIAKSGLTPNATVYNDLNVHLECITLYRYISRLRMCVFCTFLLDSGPVLKNSVETFFSGTFHLRERLFQRTNGYMKPVKCKSLSTVPNEIDVLGLYKLFEGFIVGKLQDRDPLQHSGVVNKCLSLIFEYLREPDEEDMSSQNFDELTPFVFEDVDDETDAEIDDEDSDEDSDRSNRQDDSDCEEIDQLKDESDNQSEGSSDVDSDDNDQNGDSDEDDDDDSSVDAEAVYIISKDLREITIQDIHSIFKPHLEQFVHDFQLIAEKYHSRELFLELFQKPSNVAKEYAYIAWISIYFIQYSLKQRNCEYVRILFLNLDVGLDYEDNNFALQTNQYFELYCLRGLEVFLFFRTLFQVLAVKPAILEREKRPTSRICSEKGIDFIVNLNISLDRSSVHLLSRNDRNQLQVGSDTSDLNLIEPFDALRDLYLKKRKEAPVIDSAAERVSHLSSDITTDSDADDFDINDIQGQFMYHPEELSTFTDIINEMYLVETYSPKKKFQYHAMKILLTLYIMHISKNLDFEGKRIGYVIVVDSLLDTILGGKQSLVRNFAQEFGFIPNDEDPRKRIVIYKKRRAYAQKLQEEPIISEIPLLGVFSQIQVTKTYCQGTLNRTYVEKAQISSTEDGSQLYPYNFCDQVVKNLWDFLNQDSNNKITLADLEEYKSQMQTYMNTFLSLKVGDDLDSTFYILKFDDCVFEFTHRVVIEAAIFPAIKEITSFIATFMFRAAHFLSTPWHTFIMLENFSGNTDNFDSNLLQQLLKYEIKRQLGIFYDNNIKFDRSDYSLVDVKEADIVFINNEPLGLYSFTTGTTHLHRTFNASYAMKFYLEDNTTQGLTIYDMKNSSGGKNHLGRKLDTDSLFVFVKQGDKIFYPLKGFYISNDTNKTVCIDFFRFPGATVADTIPESSLSTIDYQRIGKRSFSQEFFDSEEYTACPMFILGISYSPHQPLIEIDISTPLSETFGFGIRTSDPFTACHN